MSNLSGKPTFMSVLLKDGCAAAYDPKQTVMKKPPEGILVFLGGPGRNRTTDTRIFNSLARLDIAVKSKGYATIG